jgi:DNA topoisomerase-1
MEKLGIGRPSTYSSTISTLYERKYISSEKGILAPTEQGIETAEKLNTYFTPFMDTTYTAKMEQSLDNIVAGNDSRLGLLNDFYHQFEPLYETALKEMKKTEPKLTGEMCPICGSPLAIKKSKYGEFVACSNYPTCNYVKPKETKPLEFHQDKTCPKCGRPLVKRKSKKGEFYACSGYPECAYILGNENTKVNEDVVSDRLCPKCGKPLLIKKGRYGHSDFYACSGFPKCRFTEAVEKKTK